MTPPQNGFAPTRFSTDDFPEPDRLEALREFIGRAILNMDIERMPGERYRADWTLSALPNLSMNDTMSVGMQLRRRLAQVDSDDLVLCVSQGGGHVLHQRGREVALGGGRAVLVTGLDPFDVAMPREERTLAFRLPLKVIAPMLGDFDGVLTRLIPDCEALRLLAGYARAIASMPALESPEARRIVANHVHDLVALVLGATRDAAEIANGRGLRAARLNAIKADIAQNLASGDLSVVAVAKRQRITPRYVQLLFESEGTTFSRFVMQQRLARVHRALTDPRLSDLSIGAIAFETGFGDLSTFNHAFRRHYAATPSEVRAAASERIPS